MAYPLQGLPTGADLDASTFLQNLFNQARDNKVKKITLPKNTYRINKPLYIWGDGVEIDFSGSTLLSYANASGNKRAEIGIINAHGDMVETDVNIVSYLRSVYQGKHTPPANSPVLRTIENVDSTTSRITTSNNAYFSVGDEILLKGWTRAEGFPYVATKFEPELHVLAKVVATDSAYLYVDYASPFTYPPFVDNSNFKSRAIKVKTIKDVSIKNVKIIDKTNSIAKRGTMTLAELELATCGISPMLADNFKLENVWVENHRQPAVYPYCTRNLHFKNVHGEKPQSWEVGGYVVCFMSSREIQCERITGNSCRHIVDFSTNSNNARIYDSWGKDTFSTTLASHGQCEHDIYYFNSKGTVGFGSGLEEFPQINSDYTFENCQVELVQYIDKSKWINNVSFKNCKVHMLSNPTFLNFLIENSDVYLENQVRQPAVNVRDNPIKTSFKMSKVNMTIFILDNTQKVFYLMGYDEINFNDLTTKLDSNSFVETLMFAFDNTKDILLNDIKGDSIQFRYTNIKHRDARINASNLNLKSFAGYLFFIYTLTDCDLMVNIKDSRIEQNGTAAAPLNIFYIMRGSGGGATLTNSTIRGAIHDNYLIGRDNAKIHGNISTTDMVKTHHNIVKSLGSGSIFDNGENTPL